MNTLKELDLQPGDVVGCSHSRNPYDVVRIADDTAHPCASHYRIGALVALERGGVGHQGVKTSDMKSWHLVSRAVRNETAEADRPLEPQTEGTHIHAALLAGDDASVPNYFPIERSAVMLAQDDQFIAAFLNALADKIHADNVKAGWWTDIKTGESILHTRNVPEMLMLIVSEVAEAMEGHRKGLMDDKLPHRPMMQTELVDAAIRILDLAGSRMSIEREGFADEDWMAREGRLAQYGESVQHPFGDIFVEKRAYNASRADHKIENRLKEGGKAF